MKTKSMLVATVTLLLCSVAGAVTNYWGANNVLRSLNSSGTNTYSGGGGSGGGGSGTTTWYPTNTVLWLRASTLSGGNGTAVTSWNDPTNNITATNVNSTCYLSNGFVYFPGAANGWLMVPDQNSLDFANGSVTSAFTAFVRYYTNAIAYDHSTLFSKGNDVQANYGLRLESTANTAQFYATDVSSTWIVFTGSNPATGPGTNVLMVSGWDETTANSWHVTMSNPNGDLSLSGASPNAMAANTNGLLIGAFWTIGTPTFYMHGGISEIVLYNRVVSGVEKSNLLYYGSTQ